MIDSKLLCPKNNYTYQNINKYFDSGVKISLITKIGNNCVIGENTDIGDNSFITKSTIGHNCKIGKNVVIKNSIIWN